jgi:hypothetical protein
MMLSEKLGGFNCRDSSGSPVNSSVCIESNTAILHQNASEVSQTSFCSSVDSRLEFERDDPRIDPTDLKISQGKIKK